MQNRAVVDSSLSAFLRWFALLLNAELVSRGEGGALDCLALQQGPATTTTNTLTLELGMDKVNLLQVQIHFVLFCITARTILDEMYQR